MTPTISPQAKTLPSLACATPPETYRATPANVSGGFYSNPGQAGNLGYSSLSTTPQRAEHDRKAGGGFLPFIGTAATHLIDVQARIAQARKDRVRVRHLLKRERLLVARCVALGARDD